MHQIYEDGGTFNFIYQIPKIILSSIISSILNVLLKSLSLTEKNVLDIKQDKYNSMQEIIMSDHKPVYSYFTLNFE